MARSKKITMVFLLAAVALTLAALAKQATVSLQEGLYAEEVEGNLDAAIKIYEQVINDSSAQRSAVAQAMYRQGMCYLKKQQEQQARLVFGKLVAEYSDQTSIVSKVKPLLDELGNADPAALMPPDTLIYMEMGSPGKQVETILSTLKGTPFENPLSAIGHNGGSPQAGKSPGDIVAGFLNPSMMAEFKKIRGVGVGITGVELNNPPFIVVLFPGKSDALRGLIMAGLVMLGKPVEAVDGMQCVAFPDGGGAAYDDTVVIFANPKAYSAGQLQWSVKQYKGLTHEPTLASSNKSFAKVNKKDRQENALTVWANVDEVFAGLTKVFPEGQIPQEVRAADAFGDFKNIDDLIAFLSIQGDGIALEANVAFKDGHNCVAYNMIRTAKLRKDGFKAIPSEAVALVSVGLSGADSVQAQMLREQIKKAMGLEIGGDVFANIEQITLFALPVDSASKAALPGIPPIAASLGLSLTSPNPQQTRQILTGLLTAANLTAPASGAEPAAAADGRYRIDLVTGQALHCYIDQPNKATVLSLNPSVIEAAASAGGSSKSVVAAGPLQETVNKLSPATSKLVLVNVGGAIRAGAAHLLLGMENPEGNVSNLLAQLAKSCDKTTIQFRTHEELNSFNARAEIRQLPPVNEVYGPIMQLSRAISEAKAQARAEKRMAEIPASIRKASRSPVIDGMAEDVWSEAREYKISNVIYSPVSSNEDFSASYKAMFDTENLYLLVDVTDDNLKNDSGDYWLDDCIEVFIDADNSKSTNYGDNDYQYFFEWAEANPRIGEARHSRTEGVEFTIRRTNVGYRAEIRFPWSTLGTKPSAGSRIGLDVHVNDDDDGGDRDTKITWYGKEDNAWQNPEAFGTAELAGLIGWWKFDGNASDSSGSANHGTENGNPTYVAGKFGQAISFDGDGDRIEVPATVADNPELYAAQEASVSAWVKTTMPAAAVANRSVIRHEFHFTPLQTSPLQTFPQGAWAAAFTDQDGSRVLHFTPFDWSKINDDKWHHCGVTYNNGIHEVWIDGTKQASNNLGSFPLWTRDNQPWVFGGRERGEGDGEHYRGELDDVRIYNYALSEGEIKALYSQSE